MNENAAEEGSTRTVNAVNTAVDIVEALHALDGATMTEVAEHLDASKSAVHSHLHTLERRDVVVRDGFEYRPSYRFIDIGESLKRVHYAIYQHGKDRVAELAEETDEFAQIMIQELGVGVHIFNTGGKKGIFTQKYPLGTPCPLHCTAAGKAILAHLPEERTHEIVHESELERVTDQTITDPSRLEEELETIRDENVALSSEEAVRGMRGVASPVLDGDGAPLGSINVSGPVSRVKGERFRTEIPERVIEASNVIEITMMNERRYRDG